MIVIIEGLGISLISNEAHIFVIYSEETNEIVEKTSCYCFWNNNSTNKRLKISGKFYPNKSNSDCFKVVKGINNINFDPINGVMEVNIHDIIKNKNHKLTYTVIKSKEKEFMYNKPSKCKYWKMNLLSITM
jgi:hypothetical protein